MNMVDRAVLYAGVALAAVLGAVGISNLKDIHGSLKVKAQLTGPIQISAPNLGSCMVDNGYVEIPPVANTSVQWYSAKNAYYVVFQKNQDPFGANAVDIIPVPADGAAHGKQLDPSAVTNCTTYQQCVYSYSISTKADGSDSCLAGGVGTFGVIVKPPGG